MIKNYKELEGFIYFKIILPLRKKLKIHPYFLYFYTIYLESENPERKHKIFPAFGDIAVSYNSYPTKSSLIDDITKLWTEKGFIVNSVFVTSSNKFKNKYEFLFWTDNLKNGIPDSDVYDFLKCKEGER